MTAATPGPTGKLEVRRTIAAPRERVFEAFARQEQMDRWMCRDAASHVIKYLKFDFRVGGGFMLDIRTPEGDIYIHHSTYIEIKRPEKIDFTWNLEHTDAAATKQCSIPRTPSSPSSCWSAENQQRSCSLTISARPPPRNAAITSAAGPAAWKNSRTP